MWEYHPQVRISSNTSFVFLNGVHICEVALNFFTGRKLPMSSNKDLQFKLTGGTNDKAEKPHAAETMSHMLTRYPPSGQAVTGRQGFDTKKKYNNSSRHYDSQHLQGFRRSDKGGANRYRSLEQSGSSYKGLANSHSNSGNQRWNNSQYSREGQQKSRYRPSSNEPARSISRFPKLDSYSPDITSHLHSDYTEPKVNPSSRQIVKFPENFNDSKSDKNSADKAAKDSTSTNRNQNWQHEKPGESEGNSSANEPQGKLTVTDDARDGKNEDSLSIKGETPITITSQDSTQNNEAPLGKNLSAGMPNEPGIRAEDDSDAETVICEPLSSSKLGFFTRRRSRDVNRKNLKRKAIASSSSEDDSDEDSKSDSNRSTSEYKKHQPAAVDPDSGYETTESSKQQEAGLKLNLAEKSQPINKPGRPSQLATTKDYKLKRDSSGKSQLQRACKKGEILEVENLLSRGADPNECDFGGFTCLHEAALAGHSEIVRILLKSGAEVNRQALEIGDLETPLMDACENKHFDTVEILLRHGADPHICNVDGFSTFTKLQGLQVDDKSYKPILELLEKYSSTSMDSQEKNMLEHSEFMGEDTTESYFGDLMKSKKNNIYRFAAQGQKEATAEYFITHALDLRKMPDILFLAARNGHIELVDILLGLNPNPFDINQKNKLGITVLHATVGRGFLKVVEFLLSRGAEPKLCRDIDGKNALQIAKSSALCDPKEVLLLGGEVIAKPSHQKVEDEELSKETQKREVNEPDELSTKQEAVEKLSEPKSVPTPENVENSDAKPISMNKEAAEGTSLALNKPQNLEAEEDKHEAELSLEALKEQEKLKQKAAEEAKIWQEKMQAKKKARKEMFLLAEKEKEKRRKEIEVMKLKELKDQEERRKKELLQEALAAQKQALVVQQKQAAIEIELILLRYPIGLQEAMFNGPLPQDRLLRYAPLYIFTIKNEEWVLDMQLSLLLSSNIKDIHENCEPSLSAELDDQLKNKMWPLFFHMVGVSKKGIVESNGREKFHDLSLHFIKLQAASDYAKEINPTVHSLVWGENRLTKVDMNSIDNNKLDEATRFKSLSDENELGFVPPKLRKRCDVVRTIHTAISSLW